MSLSQPIVQALEKSIDTFIKRIATRHNLNATDLMEDWTGCVTTEIPVTGCVDPGDLLKANKSELTQMCKDRGIPCSGTKEALRVRLMGQGKEGSVPAKKGPVKAKVVKVNSILEKITKKRPLIVPVKSEFGNMIHAESKLVFDTNTGHVRGHENELGEVTDLTVENIEECNRFNLTYDLPDNLDKTVTLASVHVEGIEGLEEESDIESESDDEYEEYEEDVVEEELIEEELIGEFCEGSDDDEIEYEEYEEDEDAE